MMNDSTFLKLALQSVRLVLHSLVYLALGSKLWFGALLNQV